jgi:hypothetical protein
MSKWVPVNQAAKDWEEEYYTKRGMAIIRMLYK